MDRNKLFSDLKKVKSITDINVLTQEFEEKDLKSLYEKVLILEKENQTKFKENIKNEKAIIEIWNFQTLLSNYKVLLLKAFIAIERNDFISSTEKMLKELSTIKNNEDVN